MKNFNLPSWLVWYKKPEWRDIKQYSAEVSRGGRTLSFDGRSTAIPRRLALDRILSNKTCKSGAFQQPQCQLELRVTRLLIIRLPT